MKKGRKIFIIVLVTVFLILSLIATGLFLFNKEQEKIQKKEEEAILNAEENFKNLFSNLEYSESLNEAIVTSYKMKKKETGRFDVDVNVPHINIDTEVAKNTNKEIDNIFGRKLQQVVEESTSFAKYKVDYITYTNKDIMSLIIKGTLKEGSEAQRILVYTYNYDLRQNKIVSLDEYITLQNLDKNAIQNKIINYIREKNINSAELVAQNYNIYVRDVRSEEYLLENIKNYYIGEDGKLYILFPYGNNNPTETIDVIIVNNE